MNNNHFVIKKGLDIRLKGAPTLQIDDFLTDRYAICPADFHWIVPKLLVAEGDRVEVGTPLFCSKENEKLIFVSPVGGLDFKVIRGEKRKIEYITLNADGPKLLENVDVKTDADRDGIIDLLLQYGLWPFMRQRPFGCIANPTDTPKAIFVSCFDSAPLAPDYAFVLKDFQNEFLAGLNIIRKLTSGKTYLCMNEKQDNVLFEKAENVEKCYFSGPHPAGNVGTQINCIAPISKGDVIWFIEPQNIVTIGKLFLHKQLDFSKMVALTGPAAKNPHYLRIVNGASMKSCFNNENNGERIVSGNVLTGKKIDNECFIGFYDQQITLLDEGGKRRVFGWMVPGFKHWSHSHAYLSWLFPHKTYSFDTTLNGGRRTMMLSDVYDDVFPMDIMPMELLKACATKDLDKMEDLGIYDVTEEDFALCGVVCPSKTECQQLIYDSLTWLRTQI